MAGEGELAPFRDDDSLSAFKNGFSEGGLDGMGLGLVFGVALPVLAFLLDVLTEAFFPSVFFFFPDNGCFLAGDDVRADVLPGKVAGTAGNLGFNCGVACATDTRGLRSGFLSTSKVLIFTFSPSLSKRAESSPTDCNTYPSRDSPG